MLKYDCDACGAEAAADDNMYSIRHNTTVESFIDGNTTAEEISLAQEYHEELDLCPVCYKLVLVVMGKEISKIQNNTKQ